MNTKLLMISSALLMAVGGVLLQFLPHEILNYLGASSHGVTPLFVQMTGALCLGFAATNWMAKSVLIGGIYARPLAIGNFAHFIIGTLNLLKYTFSATNSYIAEKFD
jgi:hypothetical protein